MTISKLKKDLDDIERKLTKVTAITSKGAENLSIKEIIKMARKGNSIQSTMKKAIKDNQDSEPTEEEARGILDQMTRIVEKQEIQMEGIIRDRSIFEGKKIAGMVRKNLEKVENITNDFSQTLTDKTPAPLKPEAIALQKRSKDTFDAALNAYKGATGGEDQVDDTGDDSD